MTIKQLLAAATLGAATITGLTSCGDDAKVLRFTAIPDENTTAQAERYKPVTDYLAKELGIKVEFVASPDYSSSVTKFSNGDVQLAWFGGVSGVQARNAAPGAEALVAGAKDLKFKSYFIANKATGLQATDQFPEAIKDFTFSYGSRTSTSGCIMPTHFLMQATGKSPQEFFTKDFGFSNKHPLTADNVNNGTYQTGVLSYSAFDKLKAAGKVENCNVIWTTPEFADYNFTAHPALKAQFGEDIFQRIQDALINCDDPAVLKALDRNKLVKVNNATFQEVADVMKKVTFKK